MSERGFFSKILLRASKNIYKDQTDLNVVFLRNVLSLIEGGDLSKNRKIIVGVFLLSKMLQMRRCGTLNRRRSL